MAKLEELSEMLVSEIEQFEKTVEILKKIQEQKIRIDSKDLEYTIRRQQENIEKALSSHIQEMDRLGHALKKTKAYSFWALISFTLLLIINGILTYIVFFSL